MFFRFLSILQLLALLQLSVATGTANVTTLPPTTRPPTTRPPTTRPPTTRPPTTRPPPEPVLTSCVKANEGCAFEFKGFEGKLANFPVGMEADVPFTTRIVSKTPGENLGVLNSNTVVPEFILASGAVEPITWFGNPRFRPTHFKPFSFSTGGSGIGHQTFTGNQFDTAQGRCIRVFFTSYQVITGPKPKDVKNINARRHDFKCVVFKTDH